MLSVQLLNGLLLNGLSLQLLNSLPGMGNKKPEAPLSLASAWWAGHVDGSNVVLARVESVVELKRVGRVERVEWGVTRVDWVGVAVVSWV